VHTFDFPLNQQSDPETGGRYHHEFQIILSLELEFQPIIKQPRLVIEYSVLSYLEQALDRANGASFIPITGRRCNN
jgi:hypothetical protein